MITGSANAIGSWYRISVDALVNSYVSRVEADGGITESADCLKDRITTLRTLGLWDKASAVWLPHGYKEGKLYAAKGGANADLSISRAGTRTRKGPTYVEQVPYNRASYSENFENAAWSKDANVSVTASAGTPPTGRTKADRVTLAAGTSFKRLRQASATPGENTFSIHFKYETHRYIQLFVAGDVSFYVNLDIRDGIASHTGNGSTTITDAGNGWFEVVFKFTTTGTTLDISAIDDMSDPRGTLDNVATGTYLICGAQMVVGHTARSYFRTTDRFNVPALDYTNDTCPALSLEKASTNLLLQSETFDDASWLKSDSTVTANNTAGPDGLLTADLITEGSAGTAYLLQSATISANGTYSVSIYLKKGNTDWVCLQWYNSTNVLRGWFNLNTGVGGSATNAGTATGASVYIESVLDANGAPTGWYRCVLSGAINNAVTTGSFAVFSASADGSVTRVAGATRYQGGAQLEAGSYATSYIPTTTATVSRIADTVNALYPEKTNLLNNSEAFSGWNNGAVTVTNNAINAPDGTLTADKIVANNTNGGHFVWQLSGANNAVSRQITISVCAKKGELNWLQITANATGTPYANFNLDTGALGSSSGATGTIEAHPNGDGWYICSCTMTPELFTNCQLRVVNADIGVNSWTGDNVSGLYLWGAQLEWGGQRTTYIPTTTTYVHDGSVIGQTEGTLYFEGSSFADSTYKAALSISANSDGERVMIRFDNANRIIAQINSGGGIKSITSAGTFISNQNYKIAVTYQSGKAALFVDGVKVGEDLTVVIPACYQITFNRGNPSGAEPFYGNVKSALVSTTAWSDEEAIARTTP